MDKPNPKIDADALRATTKGLMLMIVKVQMEVESLKLALLSSPTLHAQELQAAREATEKNFRNLLDELGEGSDDKLLELLRKHEGLVQ